MGGEFAQEGEWSESRSLDWHLLENPEHAGIQSLVRNLNRAYKDEPALWEMDFDGTGFWWTEANAADDNVIAFARRTPRLRARGGAVRRRPPTPRHDYRIGLPRRSGRWREAVNTDASSYGGSGVGNMGSFEAEGTGWHGQPFSASVSLPPLGALWLVPSAWGASRSGSCRARGRRRRARARRRGSSIARLRRGTVKR